MRQQLFCLACFSALALPAQITIGENDMPNAGDTLHYRTTTAPALDLALTGANVTWDFSTLTPQAEGADTAIAVGSSPFLYQLFFNNAFLFPEHRADYGMVGAEFDLQALSLSEVFDYFRADEEGFFNVGFGANVNGLPTSVRRQPTDRVHVFPMNFGDTDVSPSAFNVSVPTLLYFGQDQVRTNEVDGWGTLILPADTFEVLRVKSTLQRTDTIFVEQFGFGFRIPEPETIEYKWIAAGMGKPVLEVVSTAGVPISTEFFYQPEDIITGLQDPSTTELMLYPNPAKNEVVIPVPADANGVLRLLDAQGRLVRSVNVQAGSLHRMDLSELADGTYAVQLTVANAVRTTALIVAR